MFSYNELHNALKNNVVTVTFTKVDGSTRNMRCTLQEKYLPEQFRGKGSLITEGANVIRVFDLDVNQWRSFRVDSVSAINYNFTNPQTTVALNG
jgi:WYL_2, Sm-like SH3 beta-barrel fold